MDVATGFDRTSFRLTSALLVFERPQSGAYDRYSDSRQGLGDSPSSFVSVHDVVQGPGGQVELGVGRPATRSAVAELGRSVLGREAPGLVPMRTLAVGDQSMVWYVPPGEQELYFKTRSDTLQAASGKPIAHPGLVFRAEALKGGRRSLSVWAFRRKGRPAADTVLYQAPLLNVSPAGVVCLGSTQAPATATPSNAGDWTKAFFASAFTHAQATLLNAKGGTYPSLVESLAGTGKPFPSNRLVPVRQRLRGIVR